MPSACAVVTVRPSVEVNVVEAAVPPENWPKVCTLVPPLVTVVSVRPPPLAEYAMVVVTSPTVRLLGRPPV